jgi:hypothetical protein
MAKKKWRLAPAPAVVALKDSEWPVLVSAIYLEWEELENLLYKLFAVLLDAPWAQSRIIFFAHQNHRARREMIEQLAAFVLKGKSTELDRVIGLLKRVKKTATKRNNIAHAVWANTIDKGIVRQPIVPHLYNQMGHGYTKDDLKRILVQIQDLSVDLGDYVDGPFAAKFKDVDVLFKLMAL